MKRKLADVLWEAANENLWDGGPRFYGDEESCFAVKSVEFVGRDWIGGPNTSTMKYLMELGCDYHNKPFDSFPCGRVRQGVRYMWLLLAMHVAEDEGIEIEVGA